MNIVIILLSFILVISSLFLILLVLVQLPKKEAGLGQAFGSSTTDALFGPGSGNMLTKMTKWTAAIFFSLVIMIWVLQGHKVRAGNQDPRVKANLTAAEKAALEPKQTAPTPATPASTNKLTNAALSLTNTAAPVAETPVAPKPAAGTPATPPASPK
jgi:preprotein translocase subunit SecG